MTYSPTPAGGLVARRGVRGRGAARSSSRSTCRLLLLCVGAVVLLAAPAIATAAQPLPAVQYKAFNGHTMTLNPWQGHNVSVLVQPGRSRDPVVMNKMVSALDAAFQYYAATAGKAPAGGNTLNGRDEIAEVPDGTTCGAGCTYIGANGTELMRLYFEAMYTDIASSDLYSQVPFYELGRSFWFWSTQLAPASKYGDAVVTGFAVLMRFPSMIAAGVRGGQYNGMPFRTLADQVAALAGQYEANPSLTFASTLGQNKSPGTFGGGTDFWASLMIQLAARHGGQLFLSRFFHYLGNLSVASSVPGAVANWVKAASQAACTDLSRVFYTRWGFPRPDGSVTLRPAAGAVPEPQGSCAGQAVAGWSGFQSFGGSWSNSDDIALASNVDGRLQLLMVGDNRQLYTDYQTEANEGPLGWLGWSGFQSVGGSWSNSDHIAIVPNGDGRLEAFLVGDNHQLYTTYQEQVNGGWSATDPRVGFVALGGSWSNADSIGAASDSDRTIQLFLIGYDGRLYTRYQTRPNSGFSCKVRACWESLGGSWPASDHIGVAPDADGRLNLFLVGKNGQLYTSEETRANGPFGNWQSLGGSWPANDHIGVAPDADGRLNLFLVGKNAQLYTSEETRANGPFGNWHSLGGAWPAADVVAVGANQNRRLQVLLVGTDRRLYTDYQR
jgi:hypothetical protein